MAVRFYRNYVRVVPETPLRGEINGRIAEMEKALEVQGKQQTAPPLGTIGPGEPTKPVDPEGKTETKLIEAKPEGTTEGKPEAPAAQPAPSSGRTLLIAGIGVAALGVVVAVGGGVGFGLAADGKAAQIKDQETRGVPFEPSADEDRKQFQTLAIVSWVVGGVVAAAGGVLAVLGARRGKAEPAQALRVAPLIGSQAWGLSLAGAF